MISSCNLNLKTLFKQLEIKVTSKVVCIRVYVPFISNKNKNKQNKTLKFTFCFSRFTTIIINFRSEESKILEKHPQFVVIHIV